MPRAADLDIGDIDASRGKQAEMLTPAGKGSSVGVSRYRVAHRDRFLSKHCHPVWWESFSSRLIRWVCRVLRSKALARSACSACRLARVPSDGSGLAGCLVEGGQRHAGRYAGR